MWHLRRFRDEFFRRSSSGHDCVGNPCVICALSDIFISLRTLSMYTRREAVAPTSLRVALSNRSSDIKFFQKVNSTTAAMDFFANYFSTTRVSSFLRHQVFRNCFKVPDQYCGKSAGTDERCF